MCRQNTSIQCSIRYRKAFRLRRTLRAARMYRRRTTPFHNIRRLSGRCCRMRHQRCGSRRFLRARCRRRDDRQHNMRGPDSLASTSPPHLLSTPQRPCRHHPHRCQTDRSCHNGHSLMRPSGSPRIVPRTVCGRRGTYRPLRCKPVHPDTRYRTTRSSRYPPSYRRKWGHKAFAARSSPKRIRRLCNCIRRCSPCHKPRSSLDCFAYLCKDYDRAPAVTDTTGQHLAVGPRQVSLLLQHPPACRRPVARPCRSPLRSFRTGTSRTGSHRGSTSVPPAHRRGRRSSPTIRQCRASVPNTPPLRATSRVPPTMSIEPSNTSMRIDPPNHPGGIPTGVDIHKAEPNGTVSSTCPDRQREASAGTPARRTARSSTPWPPTSAGCGPSTDGRRF